MIAAYGPTLAAIAGLALLYVVQLIIADLAMDAAKHTPGTPVPGAHDNALFRASRAAANSLENMPPFWALAGAAIAASAEPLWTNALALFFLVCRVVHMGAYYADLRTVRGYSWMAGLAVMLALVVLVAMALIENEFWRYAVVSPPTN